MAGRGCCARCFSPYMCAKKRICGCHVDLRAVCRSCGHPLFDARSAALRTVKYRED